MKRKIHIMRKTCKLAAGAALLLLSCSKEPAEIFAPETHIGFSRPAVSMSGPEISEMHTRGTLYDNFPEGGSFGVLGYLKSNDNDAASDWTTKYQFVAPDIFYQKEVKYSNGGCTYSGLQAWDANTAGRYTFFAYYPYNGNFAVSPNTAGAPSFTWTMPFEGGDTGTSRSLDAAVDAMVAVRYNHTKARGNVDFTFSHLMTAIRFKINNFDDDTPVRINKITLSGAFYRTTTLDYTPVAGANHVTRTTSGSYNGTYTIFDNAEPFTVESGQSFFVTDAAGTVPILLLLPGVDDTNPAITGLGTGVSFSCDYSFINEGQRGGNALDYAFEPGTLYTVNLNFIGDSFTIYITSDNWENGSDNGIVIQ